MLKFVSYLVSVCIGLWIGSIISEVPDYYLELKQDQVILYNTESKETINTTLDSLSNSLLKDNL